MSAVILGAGSWGSALAISFSQVMDITLWARNKDLIATIRHERINPNYLSREIKFPTNIQVTSLLNEALHNKELLIIATPLSALRDMLQMIKLNYIDGAIPDIIWLCKGIEAETMLLPHQIIEEELGSINNFGALLGPSFAKEVATGLPTAITLVSKNSEFARKWINKFSLIPNFRVYANNDVIGAEAGAAVKNIMAIASGISDGLSLGNNARAALITRSLNELSSLVLALGGNSATIYGLTGIGDLILTCTGDLSRNRMVGLELAKGKKLAIILVNLGHVAEGVYATKAIYQLSQKLELTMPIVTAIYDILYRDLEITLVINRLLSREPKFEN